jgi:hypothetical protein
MGLKFYSCSSINHVDFAVEDVGFVCFYDAVAVVAGYLFWVRCYIFRFHFGVEVAAVMFVFS